MDTPARLFAAPATVLVAALTGANILDGTATPTPTGSTIRLQGGGELDSDTHASGPVHVAIHPWQLKLADPTTARLTDTIRGVQHDGGAVKVRLGRFVVHAPAGDKSHSQLSEGALVGVRASPSDVHLLDAPA
jgi:hypothetical protein